MTAVWERIQWPKERVFSIACAELFILVGSCCNSRKVSYERLETLWEENRTNNRKNSPSPSPPQPETITAPAMTTELLRYCSRPQSLRFCGHFNTCSALLELVLMFGKNDWLRNVTGAGKVGKKIRASSYFTQAS